MTSGIRPQSSYTVRGNGVPYFSLFRIGGVSTKPPRRVPNSGNLLQQFKVIHHPGLVNEAFQWAVETED